jgi:alpha-1,2-mannosyltransferase
MIETAVGDRAGAPRWFNDTRVLMKLGVLTWLAPVLVIACLVAVKPLARTVTPLYHQASLDWRAGNDLYRGPRGMNYLPQFAVLFFPFQQLPPPVGDIAWRLCAAGLLAAGIWRLLKEKFGSDLALAFLYASLLTMPLCLGALRNGQANAMFAGLTLNAVACLPRGQWWAATVLMMLALAVKPLGIVLVLLAPAVYAPLRWRLGLGLAVLGVFPFLFGPADYALAQYRAFLDNIQSCAAETTHRFADINGVIRTFGGELPDWISKLIRVAAGVMTLGLWLLGARRLREPLRAFWLLALAAGYLMLFNPMNEANSYVILAPALGLWAVVALSEPSTRRLGWWIVFFVLSMSFLPNLLHPLLGNRFALFWHPVTTAVFTGALIYQLQLKDCPFTGPSAVG